MSARCVIYLAIVLFMICACSLEKDYTTYSNSKDEIVATNLLTPQEAMKLISDDSSAYILVQVSKPEKYQQKHMPGALNIWRQDYGSDIIEPYGGLIPSRSKLEQLLQKLGTTKNKTLLLYDDKANVDALRFAWVLNLYGYNNFKIINGGLKYWELNEFPVESEMKPFPNPTDFELPMDFFDRKIYADIEALKTALDDPNTVVVDTREEYEYKGQPFMKNGKLYTFKKGAFDRGSIPGAIHLNWSTLADLNGDHRIKSERDLRYDLERVGITDDKSIILYCQSGSRTSHTFYVLKQILGYKNVKNYDGSWIEWSYYSTQDATLPMQQLVSNQQFEELLDSMKLELIDTEL